MEHNMYTILIENYKGRYFQYILDPTLIADFFEDSEI